MAFQLPLRLVRQEHSHGCLVATIAMIAGTTYAEARAAFPDLRPDECLGAFEAEQWLRRRGFVVETRHWYFDHMGEDRKPDPWPPLPFTEVHLCSVMARCGEKICGHSVVMLADGSVLDPNEDEPRRLSYYAAVNSVGAVRPCDECGNLSGAAIE